MDARQVTLTTQYQSPRRSSGPDAANASTQDQMPIARTKSSNGKATTVEAVRVYKKDSALTYEIPDFTREKVENLETPDGYKRVETCESSVRITIHYH